jgi:hypothetical protein
MPFVLSMSKDVPQRSWFDKLTTWACVDFSDAPHQANVDACGAAEEDATL